MLHRFLPALALWPQETGDAPKTQAPPGFSGKSLVPFLLIGVLFYLLLMRPERKKQKQREAMLAALKKGDRVVTTAGIHGQVVMAQEDVVTLQVADNVRLKFSRGAIASVVSEGSGGESQGSS